MNINKSLLKVFLITLIFMSLLSTGYYYLQSHIKKSEQDYYNQQLSKLLKNINYNNNILASKNIISNMKYLDLLGKHKKNNVSFMYTAKYNNKPTAVIFEATAPDGYNGDIDILIAIKLEHSNNTVINIKILNHKETPGLGDLIEEEKSDFLKQFIGKKFNHDLNLNKTDKFDSITGATITSKAINDAVKNCLLLINNYPELIVNN